MACLVVLHGLFPALLLSVFAQGFFLRAPTPTTSVAPRPLLPRAHPLLCMSAASGHKDVGKILGPGPAGGWDDYKVSGPVVRADPSGDGWNLFYYGRSRAFNQTADLSTCVGL